MRQIGMKGAYLGIVGVSWLYPVSLQQDRIAF